MTRILVLICLVTSLVIAQQPPAVAGAAKMAAGNAYNLLIRSAEKMPEGDFGFKPVDGVRSFGQILGHAADANYMFCSAVKGETNPAPGIEKNKTTKADIVAALKAGKEYCDAALADLTETKMVKRGEREVPALNLVNSMYGHTMEHYGNLVTYMRIKGQVPPSSEPRK
jgi:uncharacterized damage-inducible protein DinB